MEVTKEMKAQAKKVAAAYKISEVWVNDKNEFFTDHNHASMSVSADREKFAKIDVSSPDEDGIGDGLSEKEKKAAAKAAEKAAKEAADKEAADKSAAEAAAGKK